MLFNLDKCKCIHIGHGKNNKEFRLGGQKINGVDQKDIDNIENVQRIMMKMIPSLRKDTYEERLTKTGLVSLEMRRLRSDLIKVFKIMQGLEGLLVEDFFIMD